MLYTKCESYSHYGLGQKEFQIFFPWEPEFFMEFKSFKYSESASPKDHFYEVSLKSVDKYESSSPYGL